MIYTSDQTRICVQSIQFTLKWEYQPPLSRPRRVDTSSITKSEPSSLWTSPSKESRNSQDSTRSLPQIPRIFVIPRLQHKENIPTLNLKLSLTHTCASSPLGPPSENDPPTRPYSSRKPWILDRPLCDAYILTIPALPLFPPSCDLLRPDRAQPSSDGAALPAHLPHPHPLQPLVSFQPQTNERRLRLSPPTSPPLLATQFQRHPRRRQPRPFLRRRRYKRHRARCCEQSRPAERYPSCARDGSQRRVHRPCRTGLQHFWLG